MKKYILTVVVLLVFTSVAWGQASLTMEVYPEKFVKIDDSFGYNIRIMNTGDDTAYSVALSWTLDSHLSLSPKSVFPKTLDLADGEFMITTIYVDVSGSTPNETQMTSTFDVDYDDIGGTPYTTVTVEAKNRAFTEVEKALDPTQGTDEHIDHYDVSPDSSKVVFDISGGSYNDDIVIINVDGTGKANVTSDAGCETEPVFTPDGTQVAYKTNVNMGTVPDATYDAADDYNSDIYVIDLATKANTQLTSDGDCQLGPLYSPDGSKVLFRDDHLVKGDGNSYSRLWIMDPDGSNQLQLSGEEGGRWYTWSPDGQWIYYSNSNNSSGDLAALYKVKPDGTDKTPLSTPSTAQCRNNPKISPDGTKILYTFWNDVEAKDDWHKAIAVMDTDGFNESLLFESWDRYTDEVHRAVWSPDGRWILFGFENSANTAVGLWLMDSRGNYKTNLDYYNHTQKWNWAPDGSFIIFVDSTSDPYDRTTEMEDLWILPFDTDDNDEDLLKNWEEDAVGTDQDTFDTDGDSAGDGREFDQGSNPLVADCPGTATLTATAGDGQVDLSWTAPAKSGAIASYTLFRGENAGGPYDELEAGIDGTTHTDTTVTNGTTYYYVVVAVDADDYMGGDSNEAEATPQGETDDDDTDDDDTTDDDTADDDTADDDTTPSAGDDDDDDDDGCCGC